VGELDHTYHAVEQIGDLTARVLSRLERIDDLRVRGVQAALLPELRALLPEAEAWARAEGDARAQAAILKLRKGAEGMS
jgi:hypothetical protein